MRKAEMIDIVTGQQGTTVTLALSGLKVILKTADELVKSIFD